jgi:acetyl-CoA carboxylase biotin carboxylase subunit
LVANRGEIAVRIMRACRELGISTVAVYSDADAGALHVRLADHAVRLGEAPASASYLNAARLVEIAQETGCDCLHPGYGFLSESSAFAQQVLDAGLVWIGPPPAAIRAMGVKTDARWLMQEAGVPVVPGFDGADDDITALSAAAERVGYPLIIKAAGGGGGKGMRVVETPVAFAELLAAAQREARAAFGDGRVFLERYITHGRHIEIQIAADAYGNICHLFERDCSAQRRHQKVIEESPAPHLSDALRQELGEAAVAAARAVGYVNVGTVEFILTPEGEFYFLEMNTRLQVEHPITEWVTGVDLVKLQFAIAAGEALPFEEGDLRQRGHAIECRIYAEDVAAGFLPATGKLLRFALPALPGVRLDSGVQSGDSIGIHYDPMIAKLIVYDRTRAEAIRRMQTALAALVLLGVTHNIAFLQNLLAHPAFAAGEIDTGFIECHLPALLPAPSVPPDAALILAALSELQSPAQEAISLVQTASDPWSRSDGFRLGGG